MYGFNSKNTYFACETVSNTSCTAFSGMQSITVDSMGIVIAMSIFAVLAVSYIEVGLCAILLLAILRLMHKQ